MQLIRFPESGKFVLRTTFAEKDVPKAAGFRWDPANRQWWTADAAIAAKLGEHASDAALRDELRALDAQRRAAIELSRATDAAIEVPAPDGLTYLGYQKAGIAFASDKSAVLIADEMGLGKTIQAIGVFNLDPSIRTVLVICPASLKLNWAREFGKWATRPVTIDVVSSAQWPVLDADTTHIVIVNYDILTTHRDALLAREWDLMICDECHALKNEAAQRTRAVFGHEPTRKETEADRLAPIAARRRIFLTGTPILNRPRELWPLLRSIDRAGLGADFMRFHMRYCDGQRGRYGWNFDGASNLPELQTKLRERLMIRRLKADVLTELPEKRWQLIEFAANGASDLVRAETALFDAHGHIDALSGKFTLDDVAFTEMSKRRHKLALAKVPYAIEHIRECLDAGGKLIVFAHHADVIEQIVATFPGQTVVVTGQTPIAERQSNVDRFQTDDACRLFVGNILAAGVGLTLTASSHVVFVEFDWRPGIMTQAEDRAHRIGQRNAVLVQYLVFEGSIDAKFAQAISSKSRIALSALDDADTAQAFEAAQQADLRALEAVAAERASAAEAERAARVAARHERAEAEARAKLRAPLDRALQREGEPAGFVPRLLTSQKAAIKSALALLSASDPDGAQLRNDVGFNKGDSYAGHALCVLAERGELTERDLRFARKMVRKYVRQIGRDLVQQMGE